MPVSLIYANSALTTCRILLEGTNGSILYTGDTRAEPRYYKENLDIIKRRRIQNLYMDTTCVRENTEKFISKASVLSKKTCRIHCRLTIVYVMQQHSCTLLTNLIRNQGSHHHIYIDCWTFGYEECWAQVSDTFKQKVHVSKLKYDAYVETNPIYREYLTTDPSTTRFHSCDWDLDCKPHEHGLVVIHFKPNMDDQPRLYIHSEKSNYLLSTDLRYDCKPQSRHVSVGKCEGGIACLYSVYRFCRFLFIHRWKRL